MPITQDRWWRILGVAFIMYVLSFIDRTNLAMAVPAMRADLHMSAFGALAAEWGISFWLPSVVKETGAGIVMVGILSALP